ncbi:alanine racemase [Peptostreptococcus faecalis]|uniref:alanine racemase n=1 Tax=Peptostreptococcus faecalis TaxID=2045015 RepID=UPI000C7E2F0C|nr:alanine racemase [Peptostreptococcus faecalis]
MENATLEFDLKSVYKNTKYVLDNANNSLIAVVKNNAYNFGLSIAVNTFYKAGVRVFATTSLQDCISIKKLYSDVEVLLLNPTTEFDTLREYDISCTLPSFNFIKNHFENMHSIKWHLEWAGLMRRSGCRNEEELCQALKFAKQKKINISGLWTHFSYADTFDKNNTYEIEKNNWISIREKSKTLHQFEYIHSQNSASFMRDGKFEGDTHIRPGIILYGCLPYSSCPVKNILHSITLSAHVVSIIHLEKGESIGYCSSFIADSSVSVAVINIGYGDGILRSRSIGNDVEINKKRYKIVSFMMSHLVVEIDNNVMLDDTVYLYSSSIPIHEFTFKGIGANSEQISALNHNTLNITYKNEL